MCSTARKFYPQNHKRFEETFHLFWNFSQVVNSGMRTYLLKQKDRPDGLPERSDRHHERQHTFPGNFESESLPPIVIQVRHLFFPVLSSLLSEISSETTCWGLSWQEISLQLSLLQQIPLLFFHYITYYNYQTSTVKTCTTNDFEQELSNHYDSELLSSCIIARSNCWHHSSHWVCFPFLKEN
jgi:hypothetical protein